MRKRNSKKSIALNIEGVGPVFFKKSSRARYLNIRIKPFNGVQVSVPQSMSFVKAQDIVLTKTDWIHRNLKKVRNVENRSFIYDGSHSLQSRHHKLDVRVNQSNKFSVKLVNGVIQVRYPKNYAITDPPVQSAIQQALITAYRIEAKDYLPKRVDGLAKKFGFKYNNKIFIKNHKSRWGSCSAKNNINLNLHLMRLPDKLIDYVILHELVHTKIKNHSREFWTLLEKICANMKILKREINNYAIKLDNY